MTQEPGTPMRKYETQKIGPNTRMRQTITRPEGEGNKGTHGVSAKEGGDGGWGEGNWPNLTQGSDNFLHALRMRGRKQGQCRPRLGGQHLHGSPEGLRNLLVVKVNLITC